MAGMDDEVQVQADEEDFTEGKRRRGFRTLDNAGFIPFNAHHYGRAFVHVRIDRTDELKLRATRKKGRGFGGEITW